jgi:hypothetical protein
MEKVRNSKKFWFFLIYYPVCYVFIYLVIPTKIGIHRGMLIGMIIGLISAPIYGPFLLGNWENYFSNFIRNVHIERRIIDWCNARRITSRAWKGIILFISGWAFYLSFLLWPIILGIFIFSPNAAAFCMYCVTLVLCWGLVDTLLGKFVEFKRKKNSITSHK